MQHDPKGDESKRNTSNDPRHKRIALVGKLEWNFWADSAWAVLGLVLATFLLTPVFDFIGEDMKIYSIVSGFCFAMWVLAIFVTHSVVVQREGRSATHREDQEEQYKKVLREKIEHLETELDSAREQLKEYAQREISEEQERAIIMACAPFGEQPGKKGQKVSIQCVRYDADGIRYGQQLAWALVEAKWNFSELSETPNFGRFNSIVVEVSNKYRVPERVPPAAAALIAVMGQMGMTEPNTIAWRDDLPDDEIRVRIGMKPGRNAPRLGTSQPVVNLIPPITYEKKLPLEPNP